MCTNTSWVKIHSVINLLELLRSFSVLIIADHILITNATEIQAQVCCSEVK